MGKMAIVLGATGLTGNLLLNLLIEDTNYSKIILFSRSTINKKSEKIEEHLVDLLELDKQKKYFIADEIYCCIGTTASKTKNRETYRAIDYGIPITAAKMAQDINIPTFGVISSMGADATSNLFYNRTKGEMERAILALNIKNTFILRPSLIGGDREDFRLGERVGKGVMKLLNPFFIGTLKKYKMIHPKKIATSMKYLANHKRNQSIYMSDEIEQIANSTYNE
jgi:uncharacterized protein YbjT (DUF2867 family)